jgi:hypothetical protein
VLVNPQRNYAQFLLRALLPIVVHVIIAISAGYTVGSVFSRRSMRAWLAPLLAAKLPSRHRSRGNRARAFSFIAVA